MGLKHMLAHLNYSDKTIIHTTCLFKNCCDHHVLWLKPLLLMLTNPNHTHTHTQIRTYTHTHTNTHTHIQADAQRFSWSSRRACKCADTRRKLMGRWFGRENAGNVGWSKIFREHGCGIRERERLLLWKIEVRRPVRLPDRRTRLLVCNMTAFLRQCDNVRLCKACLVCHIHLFMHTDTKSARKVIIARTPHTWCVCVYIYIYIYIYIHIHTYK